MKWGKPYHYLWYKSEMNISLITNLCLTLNMHDAYSVHTFRPTYLCIIYSVNRHFKICYTHCENSQQTLVIMICVIISSLTLCIYNLLAPLLILTFQQSKDLSLTWLTMTLTALD